MHSTLVVWPRNWPLRRLRPFSPFPTKGAAKSAPCAPRGVQGVGRLSRVERRFFRARNPTGDGHCRRFGIYQVMGLVEDPPMKAATVRAVVLPPHTPEKGENHGDH